jgi:hypothetical protein
LELIGSDHHAWTCGFPQGSKDCSRTCESSFCIGKQITTLTICHCRVVVLGSVWGFLFPLQQSCSAVLQESKTELKGRIALLSSVYHERTADRACVAYNFSGGQAYLKPAAFQLSVGYSPAKGTDALAFFFPPCPPCP